MTREEFDSLKVMEELTLESITKALKNIITEEDLQPYKDLGNGLYELPGYIITNKKGLKEYLNGLNCENCSIMYSSKLINKITSADEYLEHKK